MASGNYPVDMSLRNKDVPGSIKVKQETTNRLYGWIAKLIPKL